MACVGDFKVEGVWISLLQTDQSAICVRQIKVRSAAGRSQKAFQILVGERLNAAAGKDFFRTFHIVDAQDNIGRPGDGRSEGVDIFDIDAGLLNDREDL